MAVQQFNNEGLFGTSGVWTTVANWDTGGIPALNERVLVRNTGFDIVTVSGQGAIDLERLEFDRTCAHSVGATGDRLTIDVQSDGIGGDGPGWLIYGGKGAEAWFTVDCKKFVARHTGTDDNSCVVSHRTNNIDEVICENGRTQLDGGTYVIVSVTAVDSASTRCIIDSGSTVSIVRQRGGFAEYSSTNTIAQLDVDGGEFQHLADGVVTSLRISGDGVVRFDGEATWAGVTQYGGYLDLSRTAKIKTITDYKGYGGTLDLRGPGVPSFTSYFASDNVKVLGAVKLST